METRLGLMNTSISTVPLLPATFDSSGLTHTWLVMHYRAQLVNAKRYVGSHEFDCMNLKWIAAIEANGEFDAFVVFSMDPVP